MPSGEDMTCTSAVGPGKKPVSRVSATRCFNGLSFGFGFFGSGFRRSSAQIFSISINSSVTMPWNSSVTTIPSLTWTQWTGSPFWKDKDGSIKGIGESGALANLQFRILGSKSQLTIGIVCLIPSKFPRFSDLTSFSRGQSLNLGLALGVRSSGTFDAIPPMSRRGGRSSHSLSSPGTLHDHVRCFFCSLVQAPIVIEVEIKKIEQTHVLTSIIYAPLCQDPVQLDFILHNLSKQRAVWKNAVRPAIRDECNLLSG